MTRSALPSPAPIPLRPRAPRCRGGASSLLRLARTPRPGSLVTWDAQHADMALGEPQPGFITALRPSPSVLAMATA